MNRLLELLQTPNLKERLEKDESLWEEILEEGDKALREKGIFTGIPLASSDEDSYIIGNTRNPDYARAYDENIADREEKPKDPSIRNSWLLSRPFKGLYGYITLATRDDGKVGFFFDHMELPHSARLDMWLQTVGKRNEGVRLKAEQTARKSLKKMLSRQQWRTYELEGSFLEHGKRSKLLYVIRRSRPTIAMRFFGEMWYSLCALCLHPDGYYSGTWAGTMAPTDEVIAHLLHIRGDEYKYWKEANHISIDDPRSGI